MFALWAVLFLVCQALRIVYELLKSRGLIAEGSRAVAWPMTAIMVLLWVSWFSLCEADPRRLSLPGWLSGLGLGLFGAGVLIFLIALFQLRGFSGRKVLITRGLFSKIRHPMYLGFLLWLVGYPLFQKAASALVTVPLWMVLVLIWQAFEEKELLAQHPDYIDYRERTWF